MRTAFITDLTPFGYLTGHSHARRYQDRFLQAYGPLVKGRIVELGGEKKYNHARFFPKATEYVCTNVGREYDEYVDVLAMPFSNASQDAFVCVSVLEHVFDIDRAFSEIHRCLKPGGRLLLATPFLFPQHDEIDFWRLTPDALLRMLNGFDIEAVVHMGGKFSTIADILQRPKGKVTLRSLPTKLLGLVITVLGRPLETLDDSPSLVGVSAIKSQC